MINRLQIANDYITVKYQLPATTEDRKRVLERMAIFQPSLYERIMDDHIRVMYGPMWNSAKEAVADD